MTVDDDQDTKNSTVDASRGGDTVLGTATNGACVHEGSSNTMARHLLHDRRQLATFAAFVGFGLASWIMTNAAYVELGVFLRIFALQSANIYPFLYMLLNARQQRVRHSTVIWILLVIGAVVAVLMSALWRQTALVLGKEHSVSMLVLTHLGGLVSATSSVVFYPYVAAFPPVYTSGLSTGEGLSGSIAALLGIIQRPYDEHGMRFSVDAFYILCALIMVISLVSFWFLERCPLAVSVKQSHSRAIELPTRGPRQQSNEASPLVLDQPSHPISEASVRQSLAPIWPYLLCQLLLAAFSFGVLPSVMPYVYKKYAPAQGRELVTSQYQTLSSIASLILDPLARLLTSWIRCYRVREFTVALLSVAVMLLVFSMQSEPVLSSSSSGYILPLTAHVGYLASYAYTQTMIYLTLKRISDTSPTLVPAQRAYQWSGFATQIGAFIGTLVIFPLVYWDESIFLSE